MEYEKNKKIVLIKINKDYSKIILYMKQVKESLI